MAVVGNLEQLEAAFLHSNLDRSRSSIKCILDEFLDGVGRSVDNLEGRVRTRRLSQPTSAAAIRLTTSALSFRIGLGAIDAAAVAAASSTSLSTSIKRQN